MKKAWILDTDIGWDPDDIIALLSLLIYINKSGDKIAIISSNETIKNNRAYIIKIIVDQIIPNNKICIASGININNSELNLFSTQLLKYRDINKTILNIFNIIDFINDCKNDKYYITWIGIGSMTNLAYLLKLNIRPDYVYQMGGTIYNEVEFNIKLDTTSCKYVLENWNNSDTLEFITLDTTGYNLLWIKSNEEENLFERLNSKFKKILSQKYPFILKIILENIYSDNYNIGYSGSSSLHDPLTIMYALDNSILKTYNSNIYCKINGIWNTKIEKNIVYELNNKKNIYFKRWWNDNKDNPNMEYLDYINPNCKISIGPLNECEINNFINKLFILLS
jgi:inosine-uridine nucleoside N-ribohydrolase